MNYEKAYKEALERAKSKIENDKGHVLYEDDIKEIFPELVESEGEQIRKELIRYLPYCDDISKDTKERWITWLEKQGEQKLSWSERDERTLNNIIEEIRPFGECPDYPTDEDRKYYYGRTKMIDWLKSIKDRIKGE